MKELVEKGLSTREIAKILGKSQGFVKYNLKKLGIQTKHKIKIYPIIDGKKQCSVCKDFKILDEFYKKEKGKDTRHNVCKKCSNKSSIEQMILMKIRMIEYKGGKCERCNIELEESHYSIYDFHHKDPSEKDSNFSGIRGWSWERVKKEIEKCELLCSNCHRIKHALLV